ncbi:MAG TPA: hydroxyacid dehydrogenase [Acetobacteraceae bacterium]|jgi:D-3-phosphoglycerate dehydrogenase|nr:hydroxyacid dehydrogenase [Acetobacteraceae bacterium]
MPTIVLCRPLHASGMALLEARHDVTIRQLARPSPAELAAAVSGAQAVLVGLEKVDEALLDRAPEMKIVSRFGVGYDTVDIPACTRRGVVVGVTNGGNDLAVAEHTMMLLLAVARRTIEMDASVRAGTWMIREGRPMGELAGRTILVVGYGRIGTRVARFCTAFGMRVMVCDPVFPVPRIAADDHIPVTDLAAALPQIDVLTLHCPLGDATHHLINREMLGLMKPTAWLINAARGPLVDEAALIEALSTGKLEAAGLDVQLREPPDPANKLLQLNNVVLSPHNAAAPIECYEKMSIRAAKNMLEAFDGVLDPGYVVNPETLPNRRNV